MLGTPKKLRVLLRTKKTEAKTMCNLPVHIHEDIETRITTKKAKAPEESDLKISVSHLATLYPTAN